MLLSLGAVLGLALSAAAEPPPGQIDVPAFIFIQSSPHIVILNTRSLTVEQLKRKRRPRVGPPLDIRPDWLKGR
jgi:hypothetical protein